VSEYQYYDFRAIDRALTKAEMAELRSVSTRAAITSTSFTNHYEWGDLKADPLKLLEKYFDVFLYVANWGTREFYLRLPQEFVDYKLLRAMLPGDAAQVRKSGNSVIVAFESQFEDDDLDDGTGWMGSLMSLRSDLLRGDLRCLYLGWLLCAQNEDFGEDELEPAVPAGLGELSAPLRSLIEFLGIDEDLVEVAATVSAPLNPGQDREELAAWIQSLPEKEQFAACRGLRIRCTVEERTAATFRATERATHSVRARHNLSAHYRRSSETGSCPCGRKNPVTGGKASGGSCATERRRRG